MLNLKAKIETILIVFSLFLYAKAKVLIVVDQKIERCSTFDEIPYNDLTKLHFIPVNDTHTFLNRSWTFMKDLKSPWGIHLYAEHYVQGQWLVQAYDRRYKDYCEALKNPIEPWYFLYKNMKGCPMTAGVNNGKIYHIHIKLPFWTKWEWNMEPIQFSPMLLNSIPRHYIGRWRFNANSQFLENGVIKNECTRGYGDIFED